MLGTNSAVPRITLNDGTTIPQLGFGTLDVPPGRDPTPENTAKTADIVGLALEAGYRHIDTAQQYGNERGVGQEIAASGIPREELYVTSKLGNANHRPDDVRRSFEATLEKLGLEQLDLFLMHWPLPTLYDGDYVSTWKAMTKLVAGGRLRSAGVSNFQPDHLERIITETGVVPVANQIEAHPYFLNDTARHTCQRHGIAVEAWSPLGQGKLLQDEVITRIAAGTGKTTAQVILRWHLQHGHIVFLKSMHPERMRANLDLFNFELSPAEVAAIDALNRGESGRIGPNPETFDWVPSPAQPQPA
ncbi:MAG: aldo/keto reductase [Solirubrobacterales bacterium]|nr:aldo/keto reductase [Solirubrobacterales bacterium]